MVSFETGRPRSRGWKKFGCRWTREGGEGGGGGGESRKLDNFHGCPMYIIPNMRSEKHVGKTGKRGFK